MKKELKRVYITTDGEGHNYIIPYDMRGTFEVLLEEGGNDDYEAFNKEFERYATGGDINDEDVELYARI